MIEDFENDYDLGESLDVIGYLKDISEDYSQEDLEMEEEKEVASEAAGVIRAFYDVSEKLSEAREQDNGGNVDNLAIRAGQIWPEAYEARESLREITESEQLNEKLIYDALRKAGEEDRRDTAPGIYSSRQEDAADNAVEVLEDIRELDRLYREGEAHIDTASEFMIIDDESPVPIEIAKEVAEDQGYEEFVDHAEELREDYSETEEEIDQEIMEIFDDVVETV